MMRSTGQKTMISPGPLGLGMARPRRKTTPRSYSLRIRMQLNRYTATSARRLPNVAAVSNIHIAETPNHVWIERFCRVS